MPTDSNIIYSQLLNNEDLHLITNSETGTFNEKTDYIRVIVVNSTTDRIASFSDGGADSKEAIFY